MSRPLAAVAALIVLAGTAPAIAGPRPDPRPYDDPASVGQTSDGVVQHAPSYQHGPVELRRTSRRQVVPGVQLTRFTLSSPRPNRVVMLTVNLAHRGVSLDYTAPPHVAQVAPIIRTLRADHAVAGVNGDFYDIGDTGAPLGLGKDRQRGLLHGPLSGWNSSFYVDRSGKARVGTLAVHTTVGNHPHLRVTNLNSPYVADDGIGAYTRAWGPAPGDTVTSGSSAGVRVVWVHRGRVMSTGTSYSPGRAIQGTMLVGRGAGARALSRLHVGDRAPVHWTLDDNPRMAISGSGFLLQDGLIRAGDDGLIAPRTAVGIDSQTGKVLIVEVDGRHPASEGLSLGEMADLMVDLGADDAVNLDGGGSSTLVARSPGGGLGVVNTPSDGFQRYVSDGLGVYYRKP